MSPLPPSTLLGFDYGTRRIGIAVGDTLTGAARPLTTLISRDQRPDWAGIGRMIEQWRPDALVVGIPRHEDGSEQDLTHAARRFGNRLHGRYHLPVFHVDERLSSHAATHWSGRRPRRAGDIDQRAAGIILETWLAEQQTRTAPDRS